MHSESFFVFLLHSIAAHIKNWNSGIKFDDSYQIKNGGINNCHEQWTPDNYLCMDLGADQTTHFINLVK